MSLPRPVARIHCLAGPQLNEIEVYCGLRLVILNWSTIPQQQPPKLRCSGTHLLPVSFDDNNLKPRSSRRGHLREERIAGDKESDSLGEIRRTWFSK